MSQIAKLRQAEKTGAAPSDAAALIAPHGRITPARVHVLDVLLTSPCALTHQELEHRLGGTIDRVTIYRVLEWLLAKGLVHRLAGDDRVWHFSASGRSRDAHEHAHFRCRNCGRWYCLDAVQPVYATSLPTGFRVELGELTLSGLCPSCATREGGRA